MIENEQPFTLIINDELEIKRAIKSKDVLSVIWELNQYLRDVQKNTPDGQKEDGVDEIRDKFHEIMRENNVSLDELYS